MHILFQSVQPPATDEMASNTSGFEFCHHQQPPKWPRANLVSSFTTANNRQNCSLHILFQTVQPPASDGMAPCTSCFKLCNLMFVWLIIRSDLSTGVLQGATAELLLYSTRLVSATLLLLLLLHTTAAAATPYPALPRHLHAA